MRDRGSVSRRLLLQSGGVAATSTLLGIGGAAGAETVPEKPADAPTGRRPTTLDPDYFKGMYATESDPWRFATSPYERDKYAATLAALPRAHYASALEVGCSIGVFTHQLCPRCDALVGLDVVPSVLEDARARCADCPNARFLLAAVPGTWPEGRFDLVVISEVAYYLDRADLARLVARVEGALLPEADIVLVHWLGVTHYPLSGDDAAEGFIAGARGFARVLKQSRTAEYRLDVVASALYEFTWNEYCDWYLELSKATLFSEEASEAEKRGTRHTLVHVLESLLRALHPLAPFITEEIWQRVKVAAGVAGDTIMHAAFPTPEPIDSAAEPEMRWVMSFIEGVRQIRGEMDIAPSRKLEVLLQNCGPLDSEYATRNLPYLSRMAGILPPRTLAAGESPPISAVALLGTLEILVPMAGLIDPQAELDRLAKRQKKAESDLNKLEAKHANADFARNAPPEIVEKDRLRLAELRTEIGQLTAQIARVKRLQNDA